jgi:hypothetical protein
MPPPERLILQEMERELFPLAGGLAHEVVQSEFRRLGEEDGNLEQGEWERLVDSVSKKLERALGKDLPIGTKESLRKICGLTSVNPHF